MANYFTQGQSQCLIILLLITITIIVFIFFYNRRPEISGSQPIVSTTLGVTNQISRISDIHIIIENIGKNYSYEIASK